jgi:hypothetical protein
MLYGVYLRRTPVGKYKKEPTTISYFLERIVIDFQFSREGDYIMNLQGGTLLGIFVPIPSEVLNVVASMEDNYGFKVELE